MITYVKNNISSAYSDSIPSILVTLAKFVDFLHEKLKMKARGQFWPNIKALRRLAGSLPKEALANLLDNIHANPKALFKLKDTI